MAPTRSPVRAQELFDATPPRPAPAGSGTGRVVRRRRCGAGGAAVLVWVTCLPVAFLVPDLFGESPFGPAPAILTLTVGVALLLVVGWLARRSRSGTVAGVAAGAFGGWTLLAMRAGLFGTPYPFLAGEDTARLSAMAERYTTTLHSADGIVAAVPSDYPPLFPWVVGRLSVLSGIPAWRLVGPIEMLLAAAVIVAGFLLWRRVVSDWLAFVIALATFADFLTPAKAYEWMTLELIIPWVLATFVIGHGRRPLGWLAAGIIGGCEIVLYQGYLMFCAVGIAALIVTSWRHSPDRGAYARHVFRVAMVAFVVASWYLVPYVGWWLSHGLQMTDRYRDPMITASPLEIFSVGPLGLLTAIGIVGLVYNRRRRWWAVPLLWLILSAYLFRVLGQLEYRHDGQTLVFTYTIHVITATLVVAGVLTLASGIPTLLSRRPVTRINMSAGALAITGLVLWVGWMGWSDWVPGAATLQGFTLPAVPGTGSLARNSFTQPLPDGRYPRFAPATGRREWFPTDPVIHDVDAVLGSRAAPLTLSCNEELFATEPWPGFIGVGANAAAGPSHWFSRLAELQSLSRITAPGAFARASARTPWGAIDTFVLQADGSSWVWQPVNYPADVRFTPAQFASPVFAVFHLPSGTELAVRRNAG